MVQQSDMRTYADIIRRIRELNSRVTMVEEQQSLQERRREHDAMEFRGAIEELKSTHAALRESIQISIKQGGDRTVRQLEAAFAPSLAEISKRLANLGKPRFSGGGE